MTDFLRFFIISINYYYLFVLLILTAPRIPPHHSTDIKQLELRTCGGWIVLRLAGNQFAPWRGRWRLDMRGVKASRRVFEVFGSSASLSWRPLGLPKSPPISFIWCWRPRPLPKLEIWRARRRHPLDIHHIWGLPGCHDTDRPLCGPLHCWGSEAAESY